jgi:hypothetical protein
MARNKIEHQFRQEKVKKVMPEMGASDDPF